MPPASIQSYSSDVPRCGHVGSVEPTLPNSSRNSKWSYASRRTILVVPSCSHPKKVQVANSAGGSPQPACPVRRGSLFRFLVRSSVVSPDEIIWWWSGNRYYLFNFMQKKMPAVAFGRLIFCGEFPHRIVGWRAADARMGFDAVPFHHQDHAARIFDASQKLYAVRAGVISFRKKLAEDLDVFVSFLRLHVLNDDFLDHFLALCVSLLPNESSRWCYRK